MYKLNKDFDAINLLKLMKELKLLGSLFLEPYQKLLL